MPLLEKEIIAPDEYHTPDGVVRATPARIRHWYRQGQKMLGKRLQIPIPWEHQDDAKPRTAAQKLAEQAEYNVGFVRRYFLDKDGRLWAVLDIRDEKTAEHIARDVRYVSPELDPEFTDGDGQVWKDVITHVAITPHPVAHRQSPFGTKPRLMSHGRRCVWLSLDQRRRVNMADDYDEQEYDRDDEGGAPDDEQLLEEIKGLLSQKMGLDLPEHTGKDNFLRDLSVALHAHPGHGRRSRLSDEADEERVAREFEYGPRQREGSRGVAPAAAMSRRRQAAGRLSHGRPGRVTPERGRQIAAEQLRNSNERPDAAALARNTAWRASGQPPASF